MRVKTPGKNKTQSDAVQRKAVQQAKADRLKQQYAEVLRDIGQLTSDITQREKEVAESQAAMQAEVEAAEPASPQPEILAMLREVGVNLTSDQETQLRCHLAKQPPHSQAQASPN